MRVILAAVCAICLMSTGALSSPALTTDLLTEMTYSQEECLRKAMQTMQKLRLSRIEQIQNGVFADSADGKHQTVIRCFASHRLAVFATAGTDEPGIRALQQSITEEFIRR